MSDSQKTRKAAHSERAGRRPRASSVSVVVPLFNERDSLTELHREIRAACRTAGMRYEAIYVDDGSTDGSFDVLQKLRRGDRSVRIVQLRKNFGKSEALAAGFEAASGDYVVTMDADLQDDPSEIPALISKLDEGWDLVSGWKKSRRDPVSKRWPSKFFNRTTSLLVGLRLHDYNCGLKAYRTEVVKTVKVYGELHRYIPALAKWEGFRVTEQVVHHRPRLYGKTKFGMSRFMNGMLDLITVVFLGKYTRRPLHLFGSMGMVFSLAGAGITLTLVVLRISRSLFLSRRPLFFLGIMLLVIGIQFVSFGLLGEMITQSNASGRRNTVRRSIGF
jgi:glycosyltransferase involved in cell wall biosynthesis